MTAINASAPAIDTTAKRPWRYYLLSDLCADDVWSYGDLEQYDHDDYLTTRAEMTAGADNRYNMAAANQAQRFLRLASSSERSAFKRALRTGRIYVTPTPNQFLCGSLMLSAYPLALEPYRQLCAEVNHGDNLSADAYHMEATTWTNGYVNLLACAGFRSFTKSLLQFQAPWIFALRKLPRLMRLEVAPGRFTFLLLRCGDYTEGGFVLKGAEETVRTLHEHVNPEHEQWGSEYPINAIPLVGTYGDLAPRSPQLAEQKVLTVHNVQAMGYRLVNATFPMFWDEVLRELGVHSAEAATTLRTMRGDTGSSWEVWSLAAQAYSARFRKVQRDVVSVRVLDAMQSMPQTRNIRHWLRSATDEVVGLADHAWNGDANREDVKRLNLAIRQRRLATAEQAVRSLRSCFTQRLKWHVDENVAVVNTLGWNRACRVRLAHSDVALCDDANKSVYIADSNGWITIPDVPPFGARQLTVITTDGRRPHVQLAKWQSRLSMEPLLVVDGVSITGQGTWHRACDCGEWQVGPFMVRAHLVALPYQTDAIEMHVEVDGTPPTKPYELVWLINLPWKKVIWRGEGGGGFNSPGPVELGGDSLLGIRGSVYMAGEGLSVMPARGQSRLDFALDESGACGLGQRSTEWAYGYYGEVVTDQHIARCMPQTRVTDGKLYWYLLGNAQNINEALLDQGGARHWSYRCGMRLLTAAFDDVSLYQFAAGFSHPGELTSPAAAPTSGKSWLQVEPADRVIVLSVSRTKVKGMMVHEVDVYNTARETTHMTFGGNLFKGRRVYRADMLGKRIKQLRTKACELAALEFVKFIVE